MTGRDTVLTRLLAGLVAMVLMVSFAPDQAEAQSVNLGSEFIVFVEGKNVLVPFFDGSAAADPADASNTVAHFPYADWAAPGFRWDGAVGQGADMSGMVGATVADGGATMYIKLRVDAANAGAHACGAGTGDDCLSLTLFDVSSGNQAGDNLEGRLKWFVPDEMRNGEWHNLAIPLPPSSVQALDSAKVGKNVDGSALASPLDPLAMHWEYTGGWAGGWGWGGTAGSPRSTSDTNWQDFEWNDVRGLSVHYDWAGGGGDVWIDDLYFGNASTDLSAATSAPPAMTGVSFMADGAANVVSWTHDQQYGGYNVYADESPITTDRIAGLNTFASLAFNASEFKVTQNFEIPHASMLPFPIYYAVTATNQFGVANTDVSSSAGEIANTMLAEQAYIIEIDDAGANEVFNSLSQGIVTDTMFPAKTIPFRVDNTHWKAGDGGQLPASEDDLSAMFKLGFNRQFGELYIYGEVKDDVISRHPGTSACNGCEAWGYDSVEFGWGSYDVRDAGGSILNGAPQQDFQRGTTPDYQLRISWLGDDANPNPSQVSTFASSGSGGVESTGGGTIMELMTDGSNNPIGYRFLTLYTFADIAAAGADTGDSVFTPPAADEVKLIPFNIAINDGDDQDAQNPRDLQVQWSTKPNANGAWWNTPAQWMTVAVVGSAVTAVNTEEVLPTEFALEQNYPNPFNPATAIEFSLAKAENVSLTVYNVLGQRVATLLDNQTMSVGTHSVQFDASQLSSGTYVYRLQAGGAYTATRTMVLLK